MSTDDRNWVIAPPAADSYQLTVLFGEGAELSPEASEALETLARELATDDVAGFMMRDVCYEASCQPKSSRPCANYVTCKVCLTY